MLPREFERVDKSRHDLKGFRCGRSSLDQFLSRFAVRDQKLGISSTWVLVAGESTGEAKLPVSAYYTLSSSQVVREEVPLKSHPPYKLPVVLIAKLAVSESEQGRGLGEKTLVHALRQAAALTEKGLPAIGLIVDVLDEEALGFYQRFGLFEPFANDQMRLFVPMATIRGI